MTLTTPTTVASDPREVVERYLSEVLGGSGPATSAQLIANEALRQRADLFRAAFPDLLVRPHVIVVDGEYVAVHLSGRATHRGPFQGVAPTGRTWTASCSALFRVRHGQIADYWMNWDQLAILEQLGAQTRPSGPGA
jgi:predicted ester cyclase